LGSDKDIERFGAVVVTVGATLFSGVGAPRLNFPVLLGDIVSFFFVLGTTTFLV
jgi:hypothetical protein